MKIVAKEDIEAPIETVFANVSDFRRFERSAIRRGAKIKRLDMLEEPGTGMAWDASFFTRGKKRALHLEVESFDAPDKIGLDLSSDGMKGQVLVELVALSRTRTRLRLVTELKPQTLSARLLIQSLRLARGNIQQRIQNRLAELGAAIEGKAPPQKKTRNKR